MTFHKIDWLPEFERDMKWLLKRFGTLEGDLDVFIHAALVAYHKLKIENRGIVRVPGLGFDEPQIFKVRKFASRSRKGAGVHSGIRIIYAYFEEDDRIEFVEMYYKSDKANEDRKRILKTYGGSGN